MNHLAALPDPAHLDAVLARVPLAPWSGGALPPLTVSSDVDALLRLDVVPDRATGARVQAVGLKLFEEVRRQRFLAVRLAEGAQANATNVQTLATLKAQRKAMRQGEQDATTSAAAYQGQYDSRWVGFLYQGERDAAERQRMEARSLQFSLAELEDHIRQCKSVIGAYASMQQLYDEGEQRLKQELEQPVEQFILRHYGLDEVLELERQKLERDHTKTLVEIGQKSASRHVLNPGRLVDWGRYVYHSAVATPGANHQKRVREEVERVFPQLYRFKGEDLVAFVVSVFGAYASAGPTLRAGVGVPTLAADRTWHAVIGPESARLLSPSRP